MKARLCTLWWVFFNDWNVGLENHHLRSGTGRGELVISRDTIHISPTSYIGTEMTVNCVSQDEEIHNPFSFKRHTSQNLPSADAFESSTAIDDNAMFPEATFSL